MTNSEFDDCYPKECPELFIKKSTGVTSSEEKLCKLGYGAFLSLWSYPNLFQKHKQVKELCDLLVVFENHIIIFSDKDCAFGNSGNLNVDWIRWYKKSILASANQLRGAKTWITNHPDRICLDDKGEVDFPLKIEITEDTQFHLVAIAHGASERCKEYFGSGDGGLIITNDEPVDIKNADKAEPFKVGRVFAKDDLFVHIFDDSSYDVVLKEVDTIRDFVNYLSDKEKLFLSGVSVLAAGENEILSQHIWGLIYGTKTTLQDMLTNNPGTNEICFDEGLWEELVGSSEYDSWKQQLRKSYFIDSLMTKTFSFIEGGKALTSSPTLEAQSELFRYLVRDDRFHRATLAHGMLSFLQNTPNDNRGTRVIYRADNPFVCFVLLLLPRLENQDDKEYRRIRMDLLRDYCFIVKSDLPDVKIVIGIAHETNEEYMSSEDFISVDTSEWNAEDQEYAEELKEDYIKQGLLGERQQIGVTYNRTSEPSEKRIKGRDRNKPCPCGSGKKYKKCCGAIK